MRLDSHHIAQVLCRPGATVLDVGCGPGVVAQRFIDLGCTVVGLDLDPSAVAAMEARGATAHVVDLDNDDLGHVLDGAKFDVVVCLDVLEHTKDPGTVLASLLERLDASGDVIISLPNVTHGDVRVSLLGGEFTYREEGLLDATHLRFFDRRSVDELLTAAGLEIAELHPVVMPLGGTELGVDLDAVPADVLEQIRGDDDSTIYQWVFRARRAGAERRPVPFAPLLDELAAVTAVKDSAEGYVDHLTTELASHEVAKGVSDRHVEQELSARDGYIKDLEAKISGVEDEARGEMDRLGTLVAKAEEDLGFVSMELDASKDVAEFIADENTHLQGQLDAANTEIARLQSEVAKMGAEIQAITTRRGYRIVNKFGRMPLLRRLARR